MQEAAPETVEEVIVSGVARATPLLNDSMSVVAVLLGILALLFWMSGHKSFSGLFRVVPLLVFAYFLPTLLSNTGIIPVSEKFELYQFVKSYLLPASLLLLTLAVDVKGIIKLGRNAVVMFLGATLAIVISGPIALLLCKGFLPAESMDQAWRGLSALAGSWIGGGANMIALQEHAKAGSDIMGAIIVVDVFVANVWMAVLLWFAGREKKADERIGADRKSLDEVREQVEAYEATVSRPTDLGSLLMILALGIGGSVVARALSGPLDLWVKENIPALGEYIGGFTWIVLLVSFIGLGLSFTRMRRLEGVGASKVGSVMLYLLVTTIGAKAEFSEVAKPENLGLVAVGAVWMFLNAMVMLGLRRFIKAPIFFMAVGSQANIGGAASAPVVASAFHPALAPVGALLAVAGYLLGTIAAIGCSFLLELAAGG